MVNDDEDCGYCNDINTVSATSTAGRRDYCEVGGGRCGKTLGAALASRLEEEKTRHRIPANGAMKVRFEKRWYMQR